MCICPNCAPEFKTTQLFEISFYAIHLRYLFSGFMVLKPVLVWQCCCGQCEVQARTEKEFKCSALNPDLNPSEQLQDIRSYTHKIMTALVAD